MRTPHKVWVWMAMVILANWTLALANDTHITGEHVRQAMTTQCGACHNPDVPTANAKALKVFNLKENDWSAHLTDRQRQMAAQSFRDRLTLLPISLAELLPHGVALPPRPSETEAFLIDDFFLRKN